MKCPHCLCPVQNAQGYCLECGFSGATLQSYLGDQWVRLERITDAAHCLRLEEMRHLEIVLDDFEHALPQAFFAVYLGVLPSGLNVAELGFWLLNQGAFNTHQMMKRNDFGSVLVLDPSARSIGITLGYSIEGHFEGQGLTAMLSRACEFLKHGDYSGALQSIIQNVGKELQKHGKASQWRPEPQSGTSIQVQPLRSGHRTTVGNELAEVSVRPASFYRRRS